MSIVFHNMELINETSPPPPTPSSGSASTASPTGGTQALDRAARLVAIIVEAPEPVTYSDLVEQTGLARSTASRLLQALERHELIERQGEGAYGAGPLFAHYADRFDHLDSLVSTAEPVLERLGLETGETVNLAVVRAGSVVHVSQVDTLNVIGAMNWIGVEIPSHCSALGKAFHAFDGLPLPTGRLERRTRHTITRRAHLEQELQTIRERGYATTRGEFEDGLVGVAAPVLDSEGAPAACIGVSGPDFRIGDDLDDIGALVKAECTRLSRSIRSSAAASSSAARITTG